MEKIIVTFTSYPERIWTVNKVLDSIIKQTILPYKIILYLGLLNSFILIFIYSFFSFDTHLFLLVCSADWC